MCDFVFIRRLDYSTPTTNMSLDHLVDKFRNMSALGWFKNQSATWGWNEKPEFTETLTDRGISWTFNMLEPSKLFTEE